MQKRNLESMRWNEIWELSIFKSKKEQEQALEFLEKVGVVKKIKESHKNSQYKLLGHQGAWLKRLLESNNKTKEFLINIIKNAETEKEKYIAYAGSLIYLQDYFVFALSGGYRGIHRFVATTHLNEFLSMANDVMSIMEDKQILDAVMEDIKLLNFTAIANIKRGMPVSLMSYILSGRTPELQEMFRKIEEGLGKSYMEKSDEIKKKLGLEFKDDIV